MNRSSIAFLPLCVLGLVSACAGVGREPLPGRPAHHVEGGFRNPDPAFTRPDGWTRWSFFVRRLWGTTVAARSYEAPRLANDGRALREGGVNPSVTWIGHSTLLVQLDGLNVLTDPHWGARASPVSWAGPRRLSPPGLAFEDLPRIQVVVISHDHSDHLTLLGIHWGTFDLAEEPLDEPPGRMLAEARRRGIDPARAWVLKLGETRRW